MFFKVLFVCIFVPLQMFSLIGDVTITGEGLQNLTHALGIYGH